MIEFKQLFAYRNRGLLLDIAVFLCQLALLRVLTNLTQFGQTGTTKRLR